MKSARSTEVIGAFLNNSKIQSNTRRPVIWLKDIKKYKKVQEWTKDNPDYPLYG